MLRTLTTLSCRVLLLLKLRHRRRALKQENEEKDRTIEAQKQEIEQLRMANAALIQAAGPMNLSDVKYDPSLFGLGSLSDLGDPDLSAWRASPTPSVKSEGVHSTQTCPYGA